MAITYRASAQVFGTTSSTNITIPVSVQIGDLLVMQAVGGWYPTVPAGWTADYTNSSSGNIRGFVAYRTAQSGDAGSAVTISWQSSFNHVINMIAVSGSTTIRPSTIHDHSSTLGSATLGPVSAASGDCIVYLGGNRQVGGVPTLSRGTTAVSAADGSNVITGIVAYEILGANELITTTFTTPSSGSGHLYSLLIVSDGGTPTNYALVSSNYTETLLVGAGNAQVESNYVETLLSAPSLAQVESNYVEVLHSTVNAQIATVYTEALAAGTPDARVATVYSEALAAGTPDARIGTVYTEALISSPRLQAETVYGEILAGGTPNVQAESVYAEVLDAGNPSVQAETVYAEVLVSLVNFPSRRGWGITSI